MDTRILLCEAPADEIRRLSCGEVTVPVTVNIRTYRPIADGLFCQTIFEQVRGGICSCRHPENLRQIGPICTTCGVAVVARKVWEEPIAHIDLGAPVTLPSGTVTDCIAVISPALRPIIRIGRWKMAESDLNKLYMRVIARNNRLKRFQQRAADWTDLIDIAVQHLEEAVGRLLDNRRCPAPHTSDDRPLRSLMDLINDLSLELIDVAVPDEQVGGWWITSGDEVGRWAIVELFKLTKSIKDLSHHEIISLSQPIIRKFESKHGRVPIDEGIGEAATDRQLIAQFKLLLLGLACLQVSSEIDDPEDLETNDPDEPGPFSCPE